MIQYLSFDLQGVLSASDFSDYFWLEQLPGLYAKKQGIGLPAAKEILRSEFTAMGKYDLRYYDDAYWERRLGFQTLDTLEVMPVQPIQNAALFAFIQTLSTPVILLSTTTMGF